jgi:iron complex transport system permease protein
MKALSLKSWIATLVGLFAFLVAILFICTLIGSTELNWKTVFSSGTTHDIYFLSRLPRVLLAACVGMGLSSSGAAMQGLLRNPLADPYILGVSSGAALGSVIGLLVGIPYPWVSLMGFAGALVSTGLVYSVATFLRPVDPTSLLLTGVIFNAFIFAFILLIHALANAEESYQILFLLIGSIDSVAYADISVTMGAVLLGIIFLTREGRSLNLLSESPETAAMMGIDPGRHMKIIFCASSLIVGAVVSLSGLIGFVGLFVPHIARRLWGPDHRLLIPSSALLGAIILVLCDTAARTIGFKMGLQSQLPVGAITALVGAPFFLFLLRKVR